MIPAGAKKSIVLRFGLAAGLRLLPQNGGSLLRELFRPRTPWLRVRKSTVPEGLYPASRWVVLTGRPVCLVLDRSRPAGQPALGAHVLPAQSLN